MNELQQQQKQLQHSSSKAQEQKNQLEAKLEQLRIKNVHLAEEKQRRLTIKQQQQQRQPPAISNNNNQSNNNKSNHHHHNNSNSDKNSIHNEKGFQSAYDFEELEHEIVGSTLKGPKEREMQDL